MIKMSLSEIISTFNDPAPAPHSPLKNDSAPLSPLKNETNLCKNNILEQNLTNTALTVNGISTDTRTLQPGNLYIAIKGARFDGHDFIAEAHHKKATAAIVSTYIKSELPQIVVNDTLSALGQITSSWRDRFHFPLIAVTGSNGKTTLKNMIAAILKAELNNQSEHVFATEGNLNNHIGLPLMLAKLSPEHQLGVIEMGMNHFGEIAYLSQLAKPTVAAITNAAECHIEGVGDLQGVARAKGEIFLGLKNDGIAILNKDDTFFEYWKSLIGTRHYFSFGMNNDADITLEPHPSSNFSQQKSVNHATALNIPTHTFHTPCGSIDIRLGLYGKHNVMNALAATAAALAVNIGLEKIKLGLENVKAAPGRLNLHQLEKNIRILDDTYNANPYSVRAAIEAIMQFPGKKILVLGDMKELGEKEKEYHFNIGHYAKKVGIDYLLSYGQAAAAIAEGFGKNAEHFMDPEKLLITLKSLLTQDVNVLIKGSRSMKMEQFVKSLIFENQRG